MSNENISVANLSMAFDKNIFAGLNVHSTQAFHKLHAIIWNKNPCKLFVSVNSVSPFMQRNIGDKTHAIKLEIFLICFPEDFKQAW